MPERKYHIVKGRLVDSAEPPDVTTWNLESLEPFDGLKEKFLEMADRAMLEAFALILQEKYEATAWIGITKDGKFDPTKLEVGLPLASGDDAWVDYQFDLQELVLHFIDMNVPDEPPLVAVRDELRRLAQIIDDVIADPHKAEELCKNVLETGWRKPQKGFRRDTDL